MTTNRDLQDHSLTIQRDDEVFCTSTQRFHASTRSLGVSQMTENPERALDYLQNAYSEE
jgi:hypothetical protein